MRSWRCGAGGNIDTLELLNEALLVAKTVVRGVRPGQLADATPCTEWNVQALMQHTIGTLRYLTNLADGAASGPPQPSTTVGLPSTADELIGVAETAVARWSRPGAMEEKIESFGGMSGESVAGIVLGELLVHGWDLAVATGQSLPVSDEVAEEYLARISEGFQRQEWAYGPAVEVPASARAIDRVAGFLGRAISQLRRSPACVWRRVRISPRSAQPPVSTHATPRADIVRITLTSRSSRSGAIERSRRPTFAGRETSSRP